MLKGVRNIPNNTTVSLLIVLGVGLFLRLFLLGSVPEGLYHDELAVGVNAKLIADTGLDQYGYAYPVLFRALDDYKCPLYLYALSFILSFFQLSEFLVRLPAVFFGMCNIAALYFLGTTLYNRRIGMYSALLLSLLPWHVHFSRIGWQAITFPLVFTLFLLFAARLCSGAQKATRSRDAVLTAIFLGLLPYTYSPAKLLFAISALSLCAVMWKQGVDRWRIVLVLFLSSLLALPFIAYYVSHLTEVNLRFEATRLSLKEIPLAYLSYFSPQFLFTTGDLEIRHNPAGGMCNWWYALLLPSGLYYVVKTRSNADKLVTLLVLGLPLLGAVSTNYPHGTRALILAPFLCLLAALGLFALLERYHSRSLRLSILIAVLCLEGLRWHSYFSWHPEPANRIWHAGQTEALRVAKTKRVDDETVYLDPQINYIAWMFVDLPSKEQLIANRSLLQSHSQEYDYLDLNNKYAFLPIERRKQLSVPGLYVVNNKRLDQLDANDNARIIRYYRNKWYSVLRITPNNALQKYSAQ